MQRKKTSIIILAYKEPEKFKVMFETLLSRTHEEDTPFEILVIGNDCDEKIAEYLSTHPQIKKKFEFIDYNVNHGVSKGYNLGATFTDGDYICFFNSDYYMQNNWLKSMVDCIEHQPNIGIVSCATNVTGNPDERSHAEQFNKLVYIFTPGEWKESDCAISQMLIKREVFEEIGGFDENFFVNFLDLDLSEKIKQKGYRVFVDGKCFGYHDYDTSKPWLKGRAYEESKQYFVNKWGLEIAKKYLWA